MANLFNIGDFSASTLTTRANEAEKFPFIESLTASEFVTDSVDTKGVEVDRESFEARIMRGVARGSTAIERGLSRSRGTFSINGQKVGDKLVITPDQYVSVRRTGLVSGEEVALEKFNGMVDKGLVEKFGDLDTTLEFMRISTIKGKWKGFDAAGAEVEHVNFFTLFGVAENPTLELNLLEASPKGGALRTRYMGAIKTIRGNLGAFRPSGYRALYKGAAWDAFVEHKEVRDGFARQDGGTYLTQDGFEAIRFAGVEHIEYRGDGMVDGEVVIYPLGVPGMLKTTFTTCDKLPLAGEDGLPRFVIPKHVDNPFADFGEGAEWEISSIPVFLNLRPEAVVNAVATTVAPVV